jgi:UDP-N-acetylglucosamine/UDP-N-acetylgalactosamine diphosphorylase
MTHASPLASESVILERTRAAGQGHVLSGWASLAPSDQRHLAAELAAVDFALVSRLAGLLSRPAGANKLPALEPPELFPLERSEAQRRRADEARVVGERRLAEGRIGFLLVAGGQASRLGYEGPKGAFPIGPVSGRLLFDIFARRLAAAQKRHGFKAHWYVMTSPGNHAETQACFERHGFFGLSREQVFFFSQAMLPALDLQGRILMSAPGRLFLAPNGHGGVLDGLRQSGALAHMRQRGIETLSYFQVDNPLAPPADPLFLGLHELERSEMSTKVVAKRDASEKVGVIGRIDGRVGCIEYSDLPAALRDARDAAGQLLFRAGNLAIHALEVGFIERLTHSGLDLPWHVAKKRMKVLGPDGQPAEVEGAKFETFVFDALGKAQRCLTLEVRRELEFSPVKNKEGEDSPASCQRDLCRLHAEWASRAGRALPAGRVGGFPRVEIDPLVAESAEEFARAAELAPQQVGDGHLYTR